MSVGTRKITVEQYQAMTSRGDFDPVEEHRVELIRGEIVPRFGDDPRTPMNLPHANAVTELNYWSFDVIRREMARIYVQCSIGLPLLDSQPDPDLAWLIPRSYTSLPTGEDVLLIVEVSDSTLAKDRGPKSELYAEAGVADYWIADIPGRRIEVRREPLGLEYRDITIYLPGQEIRPLAFPEITLPVSLIFPEAKEGVR